MDPLLAMIVLVGLFVLLLISGMPIAFSLLLSSSISLYISFGLPGLFSVYTALFSAVRNELYVAIPMFTLMAMLLMRSGVGEQIYDCTFKWFGRAKGGLAVSTVIMCTLLAAITGLGGTGVLVAGPLALPQMKKRNYDMKFSLSLIPAGGALGPIIPPSVFMIIISAFTGVSVGKMFLGGVFPGLIIAAGFIVYILFRCWLNPALAPGGEETVPLKEKLTSTIKIYPVLLLLFSVLGVIYTGVATPTEASAVGAFGALICMLINKRFSWKAIKEAAFDSLPVSIMIYWLLIGGGAFSSALTRTGISKMLVDFFNSHNFSLGLLIFIMGLLIPFILGMFIDGPAISVITLPVFVPILALYGAETLLFFGVLFCVSLCIGYITPPFGANLFYLKGLVSSPSMASILGDISMSEIYNCIWPYVACMVIGLLISYLWPASVMWLPSLLH